MEHTDKIKRLNNNIDSQEGHIQFDMHHAMWQLTNQKNFNQL
jgi:hypothetical protein